jgi:lysophospholipase L1-like esterase
MGMMASRDASARRPACATVVGMNNALPREFKRYVALGDSSTEGIDDRDGRGGYRGWSQRLAERIAATQGSLLYANFAVRGLTTRQILDRQLAPALALRPDLATVFSGTNDVLGPRFDAGSVIADIERMQRELTAAGATVLTFTLPDLTPLIPLARSIAPRIAALNDGVRDAAARTGTIVVDFARCAVATDDRLWSEDRIHANSSGHARIAEALAHALELPGSDETWQRPLPARALVSRAAWLAGELRWAVRHALPWTWEGFRARWLLPPRGPRRAELREVKPVLREVKPVLREPKPPL